MQEANTIEPSMIQTGDLLGWKSDSVSTFSNSCVKLVRSLTNSQYGHVGIAWRCHDGLDDELFVIEATIPKVRAARILPCSDFDCVPMGIHWDGPGKRFLMTKLGLEYSLADAIRALLGKRLEDDSSYQCVELAHYFYEVYNIILQHDFTPGGIMKAASNYNKTPILRLVNV